MASAPLPLNPAPIKFGTDGWRGITGVDITVERLLPVAAAAAQELAHRAPEGLNSRTVVIGYDRRFLAPELAEAIAAAVRGCELEPLLTETAVPTPACSWAVVERKALGALVITASHNPPEWAGAEDQRTIWWIGRGRLHGRSRTTSGGRRHHGTNQGGSPPV